MRFLPSATVALCLTLAHQAQGQPSFEVVLEPTIESGPVDGRILLLFSTRGDDEPRFHVVNRRAPQPFFGIDVEALAPGGRAVFDETVLGYPLQSLRDVPADDYYVQAVLNRYTTFHRSDGHVVKLHMDQWEGQKWNRSPGNLYSRPEKIHLDPKKRATFRIELTEKVPPIEPPKDTQWIKHVKIKSDLVSAFWGTDMYVGAAVLLPPGFDAHPDARYPVAYLQGHFAPTFTRFRSQPPESGRRGQQSAYDFYRDWSSGSLPNMLVVLLQDPNPFYDDAYAVNSAKPRSLWRRADRRAHPRSRREVPRDRRALVPHDIWRLDGWLACARGASLLPGLLQWRLGVLSGPRGLSLLSARRHLRR